jgi:hypothetical protein
MENRECFTEQEILRTVEGFEACTFRLEEFTHVRHMTVACWYLATLPEENALDRMRSGLQRFIRHHGKEGYHETITRFWMILLDQALRTTRTEWGIAARVADVVTRYQDKDVLYRYYTRERVLSEQARMGWVEPDLLAITPDFSIR